MVDSDELPLLGGGKAVLLEMPVAVIPHAMLEIIFAARSRGLVPVLAHPERNELVQERPDRVLEWTEAGAALQIDGDSLLDVWGKRSKRCAEILMKRGLCHAMASDAHSCEKRPPRMTRALAAAVELVGDQAHKLVADGPRAILAGTVPATPFYPAAARQHSRSSGGPTRQIGGIGIFRRLLGRR
jgi:protein-tyrosine phosphatase